MGGMPMRHFRPQGVEQVVNYKTVMVSLALDRSNNACLSLQAISPSGSGRG